MMLKLRPVDMNIPYQGKNISFRNFKKNIFTGVWTFDFFYPSGVLYGVPITTGTNVVKGNGTPIYKFVFVDEYSIDGDVTVPNNTKLYLLEE